jgi:hypothetical protein
MSRRRTDEKWILYSGPLKDQEFPAVTAYFDESGHDASTRVVAIGGAIAGPKQWGEHRESWKQTLDKYGIEFLHMTDFENRQGQFKGWDEERKRGFLSDLMCSFEENAFFLIGAAAVVKDFKRLPFGADKGFVNPWYFCYQNCFQEALNPYFFLEPKFAGVETEFSNIRACFFEAHRQYTWGPVLFAIAHERDLERLERGEKRQRLDGIIGWGTKQTSVHFQLADLIAYELRKHVENSVFQGGRPTRWPMRQLLKKPFTVNLLDDSQTVIPTEGGFGLFRNASLADVDDTGRIRFNAQVSSKVRLPQIDE